MSDLDSDNLSVECKKNNVDTKIFVGNVPFMCTQREFEKCFVDIQGFIDAKIINHKDSCCSRGFGFVTVATENDAKKLIERTDIILKNRILRFTNYNESDKLKPFNKNYLFVRKVPKSFTREDLNNIFSKFSDVGACFINTNIKTGESKGSAVVEIKNNEMFERVLKKQIIKINSECTLEVSKWKNIIKPRNDNHNRFSNKQVYKYIFNTPSEQLMNTESFLRPVSS